MRKLGKMTLPKRNYTRIDTLELKALIARKIGPRRADKYFYQLRRLFSLKISKSEFDKVCIMTIGKENIHIHNQLIWAILKNAYMAEVPPVSGSARIGTSALGVKVSNGHGEVFPSSPRRGGSLAVQDHKYKGQKNALEPWGKRQSVASEELISKAQERESATELNSLGSRPPVSVEEGEEVEQMAGSPSIQSRSLVTAPLGISMNFGCGRKLLSNVSICSKYYPETCQSSRDLPETRSLRSRLEHKLKEEGLTVTVDCVNLLNNALDAYLKRLIESSMLYRRCMQTAAESAGASVLDFRLAMELKPQILGPDWPIQLEKICIRASEE